MTKQQKMCNTMVTCPPDLLERAREQDVNRSKLFRDKLREVLN
jgi:post-segregation antitoxin (ccd killing protein)